MHSRGLAAVKGSIRGSSSSGGSASSSGGVGGGGESQYLGSGDTAISAMWR